MSKRRILVVDDEAKMQRILEIMLRKMGHEVVLAANGHEALKLAQSARIDLVMTDLRMPQAWMVLLSSLPYRSRESTRRLLS